MICSMSNSLVCTLVEWILAEISCPKRLLEVSQLLSHVQDCINCWAWLGNRPAQNCWQEMHKSDQEFKSKPFECWNEILRFCECSQKGGLFPSKCFHHELTLTRPRLSSLRLLAGYGARMTSLSGQGGWSKSHSVVFYINDSECIGLVQESWLEWQDAEAKHVLYTLCTRTEGSFALMPLTCPSLPPAPSIFRMVSTVKATSASKKSKCVQSWKNTATASSRCRNIVSCDSTVAMTAMNLGNSYLPSGVATVPRNSMTASLFPRILFHRHFWNSSWDPSVVSTNGDDWPEPRVNINQCVLIQRQCQFWLVSNPSVSGGP